MTGAINSPAYGWTCRAIQADDTAPMAKIAPTERSKPPAMITSVMAAAMIASGEFWFRIFNRFRKVRKLSESALSVIISRTIRIRTA